MLEDIGVNIMKNVFVAVLMLIIGTQLSADDIIMTCNKTAFTDETSYKFSTEGWIRKTDKIYARKNGEWLDWCDTKTDIKDIKEEYGVCTQGLFYHPDGDFTLCYDPNKPNDLTSCIQTLDFIGKNYTLYFPNSTPKQKFFAQCR